ncbi:MULTISPECIES: hypothetical protein [Candidatus Ichthyocystis]|uniref:hypothetical protein n=1 Tax=Candidatus Ichthyocystis TaxID=2929841 RepID=UPI000B8294A2|nr:MULTISPECIES: hypothetical protein [Ichthyocystis]
MIRLLTLLHNVDVVETCITKVSQSLPHTTKGMITVLLIFLLIRYAIFAVFVLLNYINIQQGFSFPKLLTMIRRIGVVLLHVSAHFTLMTLLYFVGNKVIGIEKQGNACLLLIDKVKLEQEKGRIL